MPEQGAMCRCEFPGARVITAAARIQDVLFHSKHVRLEPLHLKTRDTRLQYPQGPIFVVMDWFRESFPKPDLRRASSDGAFRSAFATATLSPRSQLRIPISLIEPTPQKRHRPACPDDP